MFEKERDYPTALAAGPEHGNQGVIDAIAWVLQQTKLLGGQPLVFGPGKQNLSANPLLARFANTRGVAVRTWRQRYAPWSGGVALAAWPTREKLGELADSPGVRGLVVVPWAEGEVDAWVSAANPDRLGPAVAKAAPPAPGAGLDPVVVQGLKTLSIMVNHANHLAGSMDRRDAVAVLRTLHKAGYRLPPEPVYAWAIANGWPSRGAERLRDLATAYEQGRRPQLKGDFPLRSDILDQWRSRAS